MHGIEAGALRPPPTDLLMDASLFLDFDGTLVELAARPDAVRVDDRLRALMDRLLDRLDGRVALVSGRAAGDIAAMFGTPAFVICGSHGMEFLHPDGTTALAPRPDALDAAIPAMRALADTWPGVLVEEKPLGAALHYRAAPEAEQACVALARALADEHGLYLQTGKMMIELRAGGGDKGQALHRLMAIAGMAGTLPVFLGDDDTDEPGFIAAAELGGTGILIGAERPSAARYRLDGVSDALNWLERSIA